MILKLIMQVMIAIGMIKDSYSNSDNTDGNIFSLLVVIVAAIIINVRTLCN